MCLDVRVILTTVQLKIIKSLKVGASAADEIARETLLHQKNKSKINNKQSVLHEPLYSCAELAKKHKKNDSRMLKHTVRQRHLNNSPVTENNLLPSNINLRESQRWRRVLLDDFH